MPQEQVGAQTEDGHDAACSRLRMHVRSRAQRLFLKVAVEARAEAACLIVRHCKWTQHQEFMQQH